MKQLFSCYVKGMGTLTMSFFILLFAATKTNAQQWIELGGTNNSPFYGFIWSITTDAGGNVYAAGEFRNTNFNYYVAKWNGTAWSELGGVGSTFNAGINSIAIDARGNVYAAGQFTDANGHYYVAKWNGTTWSELGGTNGTFNSFIYNIATDADGNVYAGGVFYDADGNKYVAKWNGTAWSELGGTNGSTFNSDIASITTDVGGNVYAGGEFTDADGNYYVAKWNGTAWSELGGIDGSTFDGFIYSITTDADGNVYAAGGFIDGTPHDYVAEYTQSLPVTLVSISATKESKKVAINWQTANEINTSHFNVERSTDGSTFTSIGTVKAMGSGANSYEFMDNNPAKGMNYYRLQNVDKDGSFTYSPIRTINEAVSFGVSIYPNPVQDKLNLNFSSDKAETVQVVVLDNGGKVVAEQQIEVAAGASTQGINVGGLSNGVYYVRLIGSEGETEERFVKE